MARQIVVIGIVVVVVTAAALLVLTGAQDGGGEADPLARGDADEGAAPSLRGLPDAHAPGGARAAAAPAADETAAPELRSVQGVVLDGQGEPLAGARVYLLPKDSPGRSDAEADAAAQPRTQSGEDGRFDLGRRRTAGHWLGVLADGHLPTHLDGDGLGGDAEIRLAAGPLLHVTVVGPDDGPLGLDSTVLVEPAGEAWDWPGPDGVWAFRVEASVAERTREVWVPVATREAVAVEAQYRSVTLIVEPDAITVSPPGDVAFRILPSCVIDFRVLDAVTGAPLPVGFHYWLLREGELQTGGSRSVAGGEIHLAYRLPPGPYTARVEALGYVAAETDVVGLRSHGDRSTVEVALVRDPSLGSLRVSIPVLATLPKVVDPEGREHAPPAHFLWKRLPAMAPSYVQLLDAAEASDWGYLAGSSRRESDTDYVFEAVPPGEATLLVQARGGRHVAVVDGVRVLAGDTNTVVAALEPGIVASVGSLDVDGRTIESLTVRHPVHGELPTYFTRGGSASWADPGEKPEPDWTIGPYPGPAIEIVTVDDRGTTRRHHVRLAEDR